MRSGNFVEETTTSIAGTSGNGAVTLTAITGSPRFSTVLGTQATTVRYVIEDTVGKQFESGIGTVSSNVLTRTRPQITWDGSTYSDHAPSPIAFGSTPTSGNIKVRISPLAETATTSMPGRQTLITPDSWTAYPTSTHLAITSNGSARAFNANTEYYSCYKLEHPGLLSGVQFQVDSGGAGSLKMALYDIGYNGLPSNKLATFNTTSLSTTGTKADTATGTWSPAGGVWLSAGWYYMGFISDIAFSIHGIMAAAAGATPVGRRNSYGYSDTLYIAGSYSTGLPSVPNLTGASMGDPGSGGNCTPWIGLKVIA